MGCCVDSEAESIMLCTATDLACPHLECVVIVLGVMARAWVERVRAFRKSDRRQSASSVADGAIPVLRLAIGLE